MLHLSRFLAWRPLLGEPAAQEDVQRQHDHCQAADNVNVLKQHPQQRGLRVGFFTILFFRHRFLSDILTNQTHHASTLAIITHQVNMVGSHRPLGLFMQFISTKTSN